MDAKSTVAGAFGGVALSMMALLPHLNKLSDGPREEPGFHQSVKQTVISTAQGHVLKFVDGGNTCYVTEGRAISCTPNEERLNQLEENLNTFIEEFDKFCSHYGCTTPLGGKEEK